MANYPYRMQLVVDPDNPRNIVAGGTVSIYDAEDTGKTTLLALTDPTGTPIPNPMSSDSQGWTPPFVTTSPEVLWVSGPYTDYFQSYKGMRDEAIAAREAAESAAAEAGAQAAVRLDELIAAGSFEGPAGPLTNLTVGTVEATPGNPLTDDIVASEVTTTGTATRGALDARYVDATSGVPLLNGAAAPGTVRGKAGRSYAFVAGVIRNYNDGLGWRLINDGFHPPIGITNVDSLSDTGLIRVDYPGLKVDGTNAGRTVTLLAQPDETLTKAGFTAGCSVEAGVARIQLQQTRSLNDYLYYDTAAGSYKLWKAEFGGGSPFTIASTTSGHIKLTHPQAITDDRFDFGVDRVGGPTENHFPVISTSEAATILTQLVVNFYTDASLSATRVTTPDTKCRAYVRRGMVRSYVPPANVNEGTYPSGNIWLIGIMQDQAAA